MSIETAALSIAIFGLLIQVLDIWSGRHYALLAYDRSLHHKWKSTHALDARINEARKSFGDKTETRLYKLLVKLHNIGKVPIQSSDYERPITLTINEPSKIYATDIQETSHRSLKPKILQVGNQITLEPLLLNPGDWLTVAIWVSERQPILTIDTRIVGLTEPRELYWRQKAFGRLAPFGLVMLLTFFFPQLPSTLRVPLACIGLPIVIVYDLYGLWSIIRFIFSVPRYLTDLLQKKQT